MSPSECLEAAQFLKSILEGDVIAAGVFADWLDEHEPPPIATYCNGRRVPSRGVLLRRRLERYKKEKEAESSPAALAAKRDADRRWERSRPHRVESLGEDFSRRLDQERDNAESDADRTFRNYIREKFRVEWTWIPMDTNSQAYLSS